MELSLLLDGAGDEGSRKSVYDYHYPDPGDIEDVRDLLSSVLSDVLRRIWSEFPRSASRVGAHREIEASFPGQLHRLFHAGFPP